MSVVRVATFFHDKIHVIFPRIVFLSVHTVAQSEHSKNKWVQGMYHTLEVMNAMTLLKLQPFLALTY